MRPRAKLEFDVNTFDKLYSAPAEQERVARVLGGLIDSSSDEEAAACSVAPGPSNPGSPRRPEQLGGVAALPVGRGETGAVCLICGESMMDRRLMRVGTGDAALVVHRGCASTAARMGKNTPTSTPVKTDEEPAQKTVIRVQDWQSPPDPAIGSACCVCNGPVEPSSGPCTQVTWRRSLETGWAHTRCLAEPLVADNIMRESPGKTARLLNEIRPPQAGRTIPVTLQLTAGSSAFSPPHLRSGKRPAEKETEGAKSPRRTVSEAHAPRPSPRAAVSSRDTGYGARAGRASEKVSVQRLEPFRLCVTGCCGRSAERDVLCMGCGERPECGEGAHSVCLGLTPGQIAQNLYRCMECRMAELGVDWDISDADLQPLTEHLLESMVQDHGVSAAGTDKVVLWVRNLAAECEKATKVSDLLTHSPNRLKFFGEYLERTGRAASVDLVMRVGAKLGRQDDQSITQDFSRSPQVVRYLKGLRKRHGDDDTGDTPLPFCMFTQVMRSLLTSAKARLDSRALAALYLEYVGGVRVGEAAGDLRGWQAGRNTRIYGNRLEVFFQDRKTSQTCEVVTMARGTKLSGLDPDHALQVLEQQWGLSRKEARDPVTKEKYSYFDSNVLRLNLQGLQADEDRRAKLQSDIMEAPAGPGFPGADTDEGRRLRKYLCGQVTRRANNKAADHMRYVNVGIGEVEALATMPAGGRADADRIPTAFTQWWVDQGWEVTPEPAPLLRSTTSGGLPTTMPWAPGSLAGVLKREFEAAAAAVELSGSPEEQDELSVLPLSMSGVPKWNSHSCRRGGAKRARQLAHMTEGITPAQIDEDINRHFGWMEEALKGGKKRAVAYASTLSVQRRLNVTIGW
jgi:hypothetical protein